MLQVTHKILFFLCSLLVFSTGTTSQDSWRSDLLLQGTVPSTNPSIQYWRSGFSANPDGDLIIFTPGAGLDHHLFDAQITPLVQSGYRVLTYDPRCQGLSQVSDPVVRANCTITFDLMLQDMLSMLSALQVPANQQLLQAGLSMGGMVAQQFAKVYSNRTKALIAMDCGPNETLLPWMQYYLATPLDTLIANDNNASFNAILNTSNKTLPHQEIYNELSLAGDAEIVKAMKACAEVVVNDPSYVRLDIPELLMYGELDGLTNISMIDWYNRDKANSQISLVPIPNAGHVSTLDNPQGVSFALAKFLETLH